MTYQLTFSQKPAYLHVSVSGLNNSKNVMHYLEEVINECVARRINRVLIEERLEGPRVSTLELFQIASDSSNRARALFHAIAYVDVNAEGDSMKFAETVAVNRGIPLRVFRTVTAAEEWLDGCEQGGGVPHIPADAVPPRG